MKKFKVYIITFIIFIFPNLVKAKVEIKYKIGEQIITNIDILNEKNYLIFLRPDLKNISNKEIIEIAENSLIREIIKKKELGKIFKIDDTSKFLEEVKKNLFSFKGVENEEELRKIIEENNIEYDEVIEKIKYESLWNELIYKKYSSYVKINKKNLKRKLQMEMSKDKKYEYNLSEILFEVESNENYSNKYKSILEYIRSNNFKAAAAKYSISDSSNRGGLIGWIKETLLSNEINSVLSKMNLDEISKPIKYPNGYLILKINDLKEMKQIIDINKELDEKIRFEQNRQLNQFSLLYYKKLKQNTKINEY